MKSLNTALNRIKDLVKKAPQELIHFVFPSYCLHCEEVKIKPSKLFCSLCEEWVHRFPLDECLPFKAAALEKEGVALSLFREKKGPLSSEVLSTMAAFMALQVFELKWPYFDLIIPSTKDPFALDLARKLSSYLNVPMKECLRSENEWKNHELLSDKTLLVVDLSISFDSSLDILEEANPLAIYCLGFFKETRN